MRAGAPTMVRDIRVQHLPSRIESSAEIPAGFVPRPIGARSDVLAAIARVAPDVKAEDPNRLTIPTPDGPVEVILGPEDPCEGLTLRIGDGASHPFVVNDLLAELGQRALDPQAESGMFEVPADPEGLARWHDHRAAAAGR
ncbi:MAG: hypothetical protein Fur0037_01620 [Planctomycetota bacterium]